MTTQEELYSLIQTGEGQLLEFKRAGTSHLGREISAFANSLGGRILIGVDDSGTIHPVRDGNGLRSEVQSIARNMDPPLMLDVEEVNGVLIVCVPASRFKPHSSSGKFYLREGASCQQMNREEIREFFYKEGLVYFDEKSNERFLDDTDFNERAYAEFIRISGITPSLERSQLLTNLGLLKEGQMTYAGSLLFCNNSAKVVPGASINCCLFQGSTTTRILDQKVYDGDFMGNYHSAINYLLSHLNTAYEIGIERTEKLEFPEGALREALLNAMGHRDYRKPGDLQVHIFQDRIEIVNPGGLVGGLTMELLGTRSMPRNPLLFGMMHRMDLVEKVGSGLMRIGEMCDVHPCAHPEIEADRDWYRFILRRPESRPESQPESRPESLEWRVLVILGDGALAKSEISAGLGQREVSGQLNRVMRKLLAEGTITYTIPEKPNSRLQKYRVTEQGRTRLEG